MNTTLTIIGRDFAMAAALLAIIACGGCSSGDAPAVTTQNEEQPAPPEDAHQHPAHSHGPHDGQVLDLGHDHKFHAELVEDTAKKALSVYILDGELKEFPIDPKPLALVLMVDGDAKTFEIEAVGEGKTAHFASQDESILEAFHSQDGEGKLRVTIDDTPFSATVDKHDHSHE